MIFKIALIGLIFSSIVNVGVEGANGPPRGINVFNFCYHWIKKYAPVTKPVRVCEPGNGYLTWSKAKKSCADQNLQMCYGQELCPHNSNTFTDFRWRPYGIYEAIPVADNINVWMNGKVNGVEGSAKETCELYQPSNGQNDASATYKSDLYCCPKCVLNRYYLSHYVTWDEANDFCGKQTMRERWEYSRIASRGTSDEDPYKMHLCHSQQVCRDDYPRWMSQTNRDNLWAPVSDSNNEWVQISEGASNTCERYSDVYGPDFNKPAWGQKDSCPYEWKGYVFCCGIRPRHMGYLANPPKHYDENNSAEQVADENDHLYSDAEELLTLNDLKFFNSQSDDVTFAHEFTKNVPNRDPIVPKKGAGSSVSTGGKRKEKTKKE